jgi:NAD-dependent dihydropyrimidine dehydrogenase PreA subunit
MSNFTPWIGSLDRSEVNWGPTIDKDKCIACAMCMNCGKKVYSWIDGKPVVEKYSSCVVGCTTCMNLCPVDAISFPDIQSVKKNLTKNKVYSRIKKDLIENNRL